MGSSFWMMPACLTCPVAFVWRNTMLTPSTNTLLSFEKTCWIRPCLPRSRPLITSTVSFERKCIYSTSGARDTIRMKFLSLSSRATGPKMRVPRGIESSLMRTAALSSNRM